MVFMEKGEMEKFYMLASKKFKARRNQMLHQRDENGVTYCQTENVKRSKTGLEFIEVTDVTGRPACKSCRAIREEQENPMKASVDSLTAAFMATIG
jgi:hypothetical protein